MTIDVEKIRWASAVEVDPLNSLANKYEPPPEFKTSGLKSNQPEPRQWLNYQFDQYYLMFSDVQSQIDSIGGEGLAEQVVLNTSDIEQNTIDITQNTLDISELPSALVSNQPTNLTPTNGAVDTVLAPTLTTSAYSGTDTLVQVRWTVYSDALGTTPIWSVIESSDAISITVPEGTLADLTEYWWGAQHIGISSISAESTLTSFTTKKVFVLADVFGVTLYNAVGTSLDIINDLDSTTRDALTIIKRRNAATSWVWSDSKRGTSSQLNSSSTAAAATNSDRVTSFNADGVSLGGSGDVNASGNPYVLFEFLEEQGFLSIVPYTGDGVAGRTVAIDLDDGTAIHGMSVVKNLGAAQAWAVQHKDLGGTDYLTLNDTTAASANIAYWNDTDATTTTLTVGNANTTNQNGVNFISYNFAHNPAKGIFCDGYTGTGAADNKVVTGFPVGWVLIRRTDSGANWYIYDIARGTTTSLGNYLRADLSDAEVSSAAFGLSLDADGFTVDSTQPNINAVGGNYVFVAIADPDTFVPA